MEGIPQKVTYSDDGNSFYTETAVAQFRWFRGVLQQLHLVRNDHDLRRKWRDVPVVEEG